MLNRLLISFFVVTTTISLPVSAGSSAGLDLQEATGKHLALVDTRSVNDNSKKVPIVQSNVVLYTSSAIPAAPSTRSEKDFKSPKLLSLAFTLSCVGLFGLMVVRRFKRAFI